MTYSETKLVPWLVKISTKINYLNHFNHKFMYKVKRKSFYLATLCFYRLMEMRERAGTVFIIFFRSTMVPFEVETEKIFLTFTLNCVKGKMKSTKGQCKQIIRCLKQLVVRCYCCSPGKECLPIREVSP